jgi:hypothetical protein
MLTTASLVAGFVVIFPAAAVDTGLLNLVMPDAKVLAGVNVDQAKNSQFGQYVLSQVQTQNSDLKKLEAQTGFDPTRDVRELLVASNSTGGTDHTGLFLARGTFNPGLIAAAATSHDAVTESYNGVTIIEDPKKMHGVAFPDASLAIVGDIANVKAAIDRTKSPSSLPASIVSQVNQWSGSQDAWGISTVPVSSLHPPSTVPGTPGMNGQVLQNIQSAAGGVKFGALVVVTGQAQAATAQEAQQLADTVKLLANLAQMQAGSDPIAASLAQSLTVSTSGTTVNASVSLPEDQLQQAVKPKAAVKRHLQQKQ